MKREAVLIVMSVLAAAQLVTGSAALAEAIGLQTAGLVIAIVGGLQVGMQFYVRGQVTPSVDVAVVEPERNVFVAGKAGPVPEGTAVDPPVESGPSPYRGRDVDLR